MPSTEINFTIGPVMLPGASALTPPTGYDACQLVTDAPYPDPNNPEATLRDLLIAARNTGGVDPRTTTTETISTAARGKCVTLSNAAAIAVTLDSTVDSKFFAVAAVIGAGAATLTPSSGLINGAANLVVSSTGAAVLFFDGINWRAISIGTSSSPLPVENEIVSFGTGTTGTLANTPSAVTGYTQVKGYRNGVRMTPGGGNDFTWSGTTVSLTTAAVASDQFIFDYWK